MDFFKDIFKSLLGGIMVVLIPIGMVVGGGALVGLGLDNEWNTVAWIGGAIFVAGLIWGALLFLFHSGSGL